MNLQINPSLYKSSIKKKISYNVLSSSNENGEVQLSLTTKAMEQYNITRSSITISIRSNGLWELFNMTGRNSEGSTGSLTLKTRTVVSHTTQRSLTDFSAIHGFTILDTSISIIRVLSQIQVKLGYASTFSRKWGIHVFYRKIIEDFES